MDTEMKMDPKYRRKKSSIVAMAIGNLATRKYSEEDENRRLERELADEDSQPPKSKVKRFRHKGSVILHSKQVLLAIVLLNLIDCALVLGELILDIHYIKGLVESSEESSTAFIDKMQNKYPDHLYDYSVNDIDLFYHKIYKANCSFNGSHDYYGDLSDLNSDLLNDYSTTTMQNTLRKRREAVDQSAHENNSSGHVDHKAYGHEHSIWEDIAHGLHKASIAILGVLFVENILKVIFMGRKFFHHRLEVFLDDMPKTNSKYPDERAPIGALSYGSVLFASTLKVVVFDAVIVTASFVLDLVFLKGLTVYRIQDGILILSFLVPWRVIRVVNSLIVAVLDHEHFRLKMMYKRQKTIAAELKAQKSLEKELQLHLKKIEHFCLSEGIPDWKVSQHIHFRRNASTISSMASYALGSMVSGLLSSHALSKASDKKTTKEKPMCKQISVISENSLDNSRRDSGLCSIEDDQESFPSKSDEDISSNSSQNTSNGGLKDVEKGDNSGGSSSSDTGTDDCTSTTRL